MPEGCAARHCAIHTDDVKEIIEDIWSGDADVDKYRAKEV